MVEYIKDFPRSRIKEILKISIPIKSICYIDLYYLKNLLKQTVGVLKVRNLILGIVEIYRYREPKYFQGNMVDFKEPVF